MLVINTHKMHHLWWQCFSVLSCHLQGQTRWHYGSLLVEQLFLPPVLSRETFLGSTCIPVWMGPCSMCNDSKPEWKWSITPSPICSLLMIYLLWPHTLKRTYCWVHCLWPWHQWKRRPWCHTNLLETNWQVESLRLSWMARSWPLWDPCPIQLNQVKLSGSTDDSTHWKSDCRLKREIKIWLTGS